MGFSLGGGAIGGALGGIGGALLGGFGAPQRPDSPNLPPAPTLTAPTLPQYPGFSQQQQSLLNSQQGNYSGAQGAVSGYGSNPYLQQSGQADTQALTNYQNALQGKIAPNQMISQQKQQDWEALKQQAGQLGIQLSGNDPSSAASQSTAGNQMITDFNKRYGALEQNYNLGQQQMGMQAQAQGLGQVNQQYQNQLGGYNTLAGMNTNMQQPYQQQTLGQFGVATNQALANNSVANQNLLNAYQQQTGQTMANYNNSLNGYNTNMGLLQAGLGMAGNLAGAYITRGANNSMGLNQGNNSGSYIQR